MQARWLPHGFILGPRGWLAGDILIIFRLRPCANLLFQCARRHIAVQLGLFSRKTPVDRIQLNGRALASRALNRTGRFGIRIRPEVGRPLGKYDGRRARAQLLIRACLQVDGVGIRAPALLFWAALRASAFVHKGRC